MTDERRCPDRTDEWTGTRRVFAAGCFVTLTATAGCIDTIFAAVGTYDSMTVTVSAPSESDWSGRIRFQNGSEEVMVPMRDRGDRTVTVPDDLRNPRSVTSVQEPISVEVSPDGTVSEETPLAVTVTVNDGAELGTDTATTADETATVESG